MKCMVLIVASVAMVGAAAAQITQAPTAGSAELANASLPPSAAAETAKKRIEMDGYTDVQGLAKGPNGLWQGTAMRGHTSVQVTVDRAGNVAAK